MKKTLLPNLRLLSSPSEKLGRDWAELAQKIDGFITENAYETSEESVFLKFDRIPAALAEGEGSCSVSRPVIGPLKELPGEFQLEDWSQGPVFMDQIEAPTWSELWDVAQDRWEELQRKGEKLAPTFYLRFSRRLGSDLTLKTHIYYHV